MNIGLIGAAGSGKSELAQRLSKALNTEDGARASEIHIIDDYISGIEAKTQLALGPLADYLGNLYVALERYALERIARMEHEIVITCGTFVETAVYMAMHFVALTTTLGDEEKAEAAPRIDAVLRMLAVLYNDIVDYDYAFYLPAVTGADDAMFMDQQLQAGLAGFKVIDVTPLSHPERQLEDVLEVIKRGSSAK